MFYLQLFNIDERGRRSDIVHIGGPFESAADAMREAAKLQLGTHLRITSEGGHTVLEDRRMEISEAYAA